MQYFSFKVCDMDFTLPVLKIKEIIKYREPSKFFSSNTCVEGMIDLRDSVITIIDSKKMFNVVGDMPSHIIIIEMGDGGYLGLTVDKVREIIDVEDSDILDTKQVLGKDSEFIDYIIKHEKVLYNNISIEKLEEFYNGNT
mgnify:CR=1 FL=1